MNKSTINIICLLVAVGALMVAIVHLQPLGGVAVAPPLGMPGRLTVGSKPHKPMRVALVPRGRAVASIGSSREKLTKGTQGEWVVELSRAGFISKLSGASYPTQAKAPAAAAEEFLNAYSASLLGAELNSLHPAGRRLSRETAQLLYDQRVNGLEVLGARVNMIVDREGSVVYVASTVASGPFPSPTPKFNQAEAALAVRAALESYLAKEGGGIGSPEYSLEALTNAAGLAYQLSGDSIGLIYKVEFTLASPHFGTMLAFVDAQTNTVVTFKRQAKN